jgi:hypothetical protein
MTFFLQKTEGHHPLISDDGLALDHVVPTIIRRL